MFQSTPVIADGRIRALAQSRDTPRGFNPRPSLLTGESMNAAGGCPGDQEFQSTPVIADGRIPEPEPKPEGRADVSIHARHC